MALAMKNGMEHETRRGGVVYGAGSMGWSVAYLPPPPCPSPPPPGTTVPPHPGNRCQVTVPPPPPGGIDTIANEHITAAYYAEFMTDQLLAVRRPRL